MLSLCIMASKQECVHCNNYIFLALVSNNVHSEDNGDLESRHPTRVFSRWARSKVSVQINGSWSRIYFHSATFWVEHVHGIIDAHRPVSWREILTNSKGSGMRSVFRCNGHSINLCVEEATHARKESRRQAQKNMSFLPSPLIRSKKMLSLCIMASKQECVHCNN